MGPWSLGGEVRPDAQEAGQCLRRGLRNPSVKGHDPGVLLRRGLLLGEPLNSPRRGRGRNV